MPFFGLLFCILVVFEKAVDYFRTSAPELKEERAMLLEEWLNMEASFGELGDISIVQSKLPKKLRRKRQLVAEDGPAGYVAFSFYFPCCVVCLCYTLSHDVD